MSRDDFKNMLMSRDRLHSNGRDQDGFVDTLARVYAHVRLITHHKTLETMLAYLGTINPRGDHLRWIAKSPRDTRISWQRQTTTDQRTRGCKGNPKKMTTLCVR
jgi:hypothetical protein